MTLRALVRQADVKRAVRGAMAAGLTVTGVYIDGPVIKVLTDAAASGSGKPTGQALGSDAIKEALKKARERGPNSLLRRS